MGIASEINLVTGDSPADGARKWDIDCEGHAEVASVPCEKRRFVINPYEASAIDESQKKSKLAGIRVVSIAWCLAFFYPLIAVCSVYFCWILAWVLLGHRPRPSIDDPKYIGGIMDYAYGISMLLIVPLPALSVGGLALAIMCPIRAIRTRRFAWLMILVANALLFFAAWKLAIIDPGRVFEWWFD